MTAARLRRLGPQALPYDGWGKMRACKFHSLYRLIDRAWELEARTWRESDLIPYHAEEARLSSQMPVMPAHARLAALPVLALLMGAIALGSSPILVRLSELEPTATAFYRVALAAPAFLLISYASGRSAVATHKSASVHNELLWLAVAGGFFALDLLCLHWSLRYTSVANATLFLNFAPFFVALGAWLIFGESPSAPHCGQLRHCHYGHFPAGRGVWPPSPVSILAICLAWVPALHTARIFWSSAVSGIGCPLVW